MRRSFIPSERSGLGGGLVGICFVSVNRELSPSRSSVRIKNDLHRASTLQERHRLVKALESFELVGHDVFHVEPGVQEIEHFDPCLENAPADDRVQGEALENEAARVVAD